MFYFGILLILSLYKVAECDIKSIIKNMQYIAWAKKHSRFSPLCSCWEEKCQLSPLFWNSEQFNISCTGQLFGSSYVTNTMHELIQCSRLWPSCNTRPVPVGRCGYFISAILSSTWHYVLRFERGKDRKMSQRKNQHGKLLKSRQLISLLH
jgi:hypothetical protein